MKWAIMAAGLTLIALVPTATLDRLPPIPDPEGFAGMFAGVSRGTLLAAGGANFPDKKPWDGGTKRWYDSIFALESPDGTWKKVGVLPRPLGYGVSVTHGESVICAGGSDSAQHYSDVFRLLYRDGRIETSQLPPLPVPLANCSGALVGDLLFIAGGQQKPESVATSRAVYRIDLSMNKPRWEVDDSFPGPGRILAVAGGSSQRFWLAGGVELIAGPDGKPQRRYLVDAYQFELGRGWTRLPDLPNPVTAAPSPAPVIDGSLVVLGGDDGSQVGSDPRQHRGFRSTALVFNSKDRSWERCRDIAKPRVTAPCVFWNGVWVIPSGEVRPGVRSPEVILWSN